MARPKSDFLSGFGRAFNILKMIVDAVLDRGGSDEDLLRLLSLEGKETVGKIADLIVAKPEPEIPEPTVQTFEIVVDPKLTFDQMKAAGKYDYVNSDITEERYPVAGAQGGTILAHLIHFNRPMGDDEVDRELDRMGLRRANAAETLALGAQHWKIQQQRQFWIVSGAFWTHPGGHRSFLKLYSGRDGRSLNLLWVVRGDRWFPGNRFLAVPK